jgi:hypothetical protein
MRTSCSQLRNKIAYLTRLGWPGPDLLALCSDYRPAHGPAVSGVNVFKTPVPGGWQQGFKLPQPLSEISSDHFRCIFRLIGCRRVSLRPFPLRHARRQVFHGVFQGLVGDVSVSFYARRLRCRGIACEFPDKSYRVSQFLLRQRHCLAEDAAFQRPAFGVELRLFHPLIKCLRSDAGFPGGIPDTVLFKQLNDCLSLLVREFCAVAGPARLSEMGCDTVLPEAIGQLAGVSFGPHPRSGPVGCPTPQTLAARDWWNSHKGAWPRCDDCHPSATQSK